MDENSIIYPNNCTVGDTYHTSVVMGDGTKHNVSFYVGTRMGVTDAMLIETMRHFLSGIRSVANGNIDCADGMNMRSEYEASEHGEARVSIWVKSPGVPVLLAEGMRFIQVNIFTEDTSAQDFIDAVNLHINTMATIMDSGAVTLSKNVTPTPPPVKPQSELDKHFGERQQPTTPPPARTDYAAVPPEVIDLGNYDYNQQAQYEVDHIGRTVCFNASAISRDMEVKKDKSATYECLNVWGYYDGLPVDRHNSKSHPMYNFRMFAPKPDQKFGDWITFFNGIETGELSEPGKAITRPMRFYYKLSNGKDDNAGNVYWNLRKVEYLDGVVPAGQKSRPQAQHDDTPEDYGISEGDNIPF